MNQDILDFLTAKRVGVIAVQMSDGTPHAATVHFAHIKDPLTFVIFTSPGYRKLEPLRMGPTSASFVVGTEEGSVAQTFQLDGVAQLADTDELRDAYFGKFPEKLNKNPNDVFFTFTPTWWRFTKWDANGKTVATSDGNVVVTPKN